MFPESDWFPRKPRACRGRGQIKHKIIKRDGSRCHYCLRELTFYSATIDHLIPRSRNGTNALSNLVLACGFCNSDKGSMTDLEYFYYLGRNDGSTRNQMQ